MARVNRAELIDLNSILDFYNSSNIIGWEVYGGFEKKQGRGKGNYCGSDKQEGAEELTELLETLKGAGTENVYSLHLIPKGSKSFAPMVTFQFLTDKEPAKVGEVGNYRIENEILSRLSAIESRLNDDENEEEEEQAPDQNNILAGILNHPQMQNILLGLVSNVAGSFMKPKAVAGIQTEEVDTILETLYSKGVTVADLQKLAAMDQGQISFLLSMLRK